MIEGIPGDDGVTTRVVMAILALFLLVFGTLVYQWFVGFLCFDYCGTAEEYATHALVASAYLIGPGALAMFAAFGLLLRSLWQTGHTFALGIAAIGMIALLVAAQLNLWSGAPWVGQTAGSVTPGVFASVTRATPDRVIHIAIAFGVMSLLLAWPISASRTPLRRTPGNRDEAV